MKHALTVLDDLFVEMSAKPVVTGGGPYFSKFQFNFDQSNIGKSNIISGGHAGIFMFDNSNITLTRIEVQENIGAKRMISKDVNKHFVCDNNMISIMIPIPNEIIKTNGFSVYFETDSLLAVSGLLIGQQPINTDYIPAGVHRFNPWR